jgi:DNA-directed RNA polymerase specialized sigma24 family protein
VGLLFSEILAGLRPRDASVFSACLLQGADPAEIAKRMDLSVSRVLAILTLTKRLVQAGMCAHSGDAVRAQRRLATRSVAL